jgi:mannose-6-phosphate isomerase-like protein (cupin superfamily)
MGYSVSGIADLGPGIIRSVRRPLHVTAFGANVIMLPPGTEWFNHFHREQDELYFVHSGHGVFDVDGEQFELEPGGMVHVESTTPRKFWNGGDDDLVLLVIGGKDGYVERDGQLVDPADFERRAAAGKGDLDAIRRPSP